MPHGSYSSSLTVAILERDKLKKQREKAVEILEMGLVAFKRGEIAERYIYAALEVLGAIGTPKP